LSNRMTEAVLDDINEKIQTQMGAVKVEKVLDPEFDLKDLTVFDFNPLMVDVKNDEELKKLARDNAQLIINQVFGGAGLETEVVGDAVVVELPDKRYDNLFLMPREKPLPKKKKLTKWEEFAKAKGINGKKKKSRMLWDEKTKSWKPRWGYMRAAKANEINKNGESKDWVREVKPGEDGTEDPWQKEKKDKKERVAKNEHHRLKNIARAQGLSNKIQGESKEELRTSFRRAKFSTASLGNFDERVQGEKKERIGGKRKYNALFSDDTKAEQNQILTLMSSKNPKLDTNRAADRVMNSSEGDQGKGKKGKGKGKGGKRGGKAKPQMKRKQKR